MPILQLLKLSQLPTFLISNLIKLNFFFKLVFAVADPFKALDGSLARERVVSVELQEYELEREPHYEPIAQEERLVSPERGHCHLVLLENVEVRHC